MFIGEALCLLVYYLSLLIQKLRSPPQTAYHPIVDPETPSHSRPTSSTSIQSETTPLVPDPLQPTPLEPLTGTKNLLLWFPTLCDMTATTLMNVGLIYVSASIYQMLRGSVVLFTGTLSVWFLGRRHPSYRWFALVMVFVGVGIVGLSSIVSPKLPIIPPPSSPGNNTLFPTTTEGNDDPLPPTSPPSEPNTSLLGVSLVILAQTFTALQFVIEEKIMGRYDLPAIKAVGLEGLFGLLSLAVIMPLGYFTMGRGTGGFWDVPVGWREIIGHGQVLWAGVGIIFSISAFNWFGLSVTRNVSATSRSTIDTCRTLFIWMISLGLGWETFKWLQVVGFLVLLYGTFLFNDVVKPPVCCPAPREEYGRDEVVEE
ncbi:hypothetical protein HDV00_002839 [Rhizophlyctis rosea]|nr:hypothetical protein HDV00_002839 [Rhizophlyctis rosea]